MSIEAMKLALDALEDTHYRIIRAGLLDQDLLNRNFTVATALRERLAQPEQEPVAINWGAVHEKLGLVWYRELSADEGLDEIQDLIHTHQPQRTEQEPVKWSDYEPDGMHHNKPAQRTQQEPVAYVETKEVHGQMCCFIYRTDSTKLLPDGEKLYTTPPQRTEQEPVAWKWRVKDFCDWPNWSVSLKRPADSGHAQYPRTEGYEDIPLYTHPPQRTWVGLTDEEKGFCAAPTYVETVARTEAKLKQKNGYAEEKST